MCLQRTCGSSSPKTSARAKGGVSSTVGSMCDTARSRCDSADERLSGGHQSGPAPLTRCGPSLGWIRFDPPGARPRVSLGRSTFPSPDRLRIFASCALSGRENLFHRYIDRVSACQQPLQADAADHERASGVGFSATRKAFRNRRCIDRSLRGCRQLRLHLRLHIRKRRGNTLRRNPDAGAIEIPSAIST